MKLQRLRMLSNWLSMVSRLTSSIDSIVTRSSLPPLDVVKFSGNPCEYFRFKARFHEMVDSQNISEVQKMSRLLQFLDGQARRAVAGFLTWWFIKGSQTVGAAFRTTTCCSKGTC